MHHTRTPLSSSIALFLFSVIILLLLRLSLSLRLPLLLHHPLGFLPWHLSFYHEVITSLLFPSTSSAFGGFLVSRLVAGTASTAFRVGYFRCFFTNQQVAWLKTAPLVTPKLNRESFFLIPPFTFLIPKPSLLPP